jgi:hypothetical protein
MRAAAFVLLLALLLAGCGAKTASPAQGTEQSAPPLQGWVLDAALHPLKDVQVHVLDGNQSATTDAGGHYEIQGVPHDEPMVLVASLAAFQPASKQVSVPEGSTLMVNFTLVPVPAKVPKLDVLKFKGFLACEAVTGPLNQSVDCSNGSQKDIWTFPADVGLEGAVVEVHWTATTPTGEQMHARLVTTDLGKLNVVLGETTGPSPLRIEVGNETAMRYYGSGGLMKLYVNLVAPASGGAPAGLSAQQEFTAYASLFYNSGAPAGYVVSGG